MSLRFELISWCKSDRNKICENDIVKCKKCIHGVNIDQPAILIKRKDYFSPKI